MSRRSVALVTTTINVPNVLERHVGMAADAGDDVSILVAGDLKTPADAAGFCRRLNGAGAVSVEYLGPPEQEAFLAAFPALDRVLPWNSVQRRDVALLKAYADGAEVVITIDDDNFPLDDGFFRAHSIAGRRLELPELRAETTWLNVCELLVEQDGVPFFHRGFPLDRRWSCATATVTGTREATVAVNAGLWLGDPDVDAMTRIHRAVEAVGLREPLETSVLLGAGHWTPFDSQNTALSRAALRGYFLSPDVGRMDDIWASYVLLRILQHLDEAVAFGLPVVRQDRNDHDLWRDFDVERIGYEVTPALVDGLAELRLTGSDHAACLDEVADWLAAAAGELARRPEHAEALRRYAAGARAWVAAIRTADGS